MASVTGRSGWIAISNPPPQFYLPAGLGWLCPPTLPKIEWLPPGLPRTCLTSMMWIGKSGNAKLEWKLVIDAGQLVR